MLKDQNCSKCGEILDTTGMPKWCKKCRASYQKERTGGLEERAEKRGFDRGIEVACQFLRENLGERSVSGRQASIMVNKALLAPESYELLARRRFVMSLKGS